MHSYLRIITEDTRFVEVDLSMAVGRVNGVDTAEDAVALSWLWLCTEHISITTLLEKMNLLSTGYHPFLLNPQEAYLHH